MKSLKNAAIRAPWILASAVAVVLTAQAQQQSEQEQQSQQQSQRGQQEQQAQAGSERQSESQQIAVADPDEELGQSEASFESWAQMEGEVLRAEEMLEGDVTNGLNPIGAVSDLVLSQDGSRVEYILYEVPYPYSFYGSEDGFTTFEGVDIFKDAALELEVRLPIEARPQAPEELRLTAAEAQQRLVSRILGERLYFTEDTSRRIEDLLIDRESGEVLHYVIEADPEAIFSANRRTVPADQISIDEEGRITAEIQLAGLDDVQEYDSELL